MMLHKIYLLCVLMCSLIRTPIRIQEAKIMRIRINITSPILQFSDFFSSVFRIHLIFIWIRIYGSASCI